MSIQFTTEEENNNKLSFLDAEIERENGHFITSMYRKKTHTDRYLNYKTLEYTYSSEQRYSLTIIHISEENKRLRMSGF